MIDAAPLPLLEGEEGETIRGWGRLLREPGAELEPLGPAGCSGVAWKGK